MPKKIGEIGNRYGKLLVLEEAGKNKWGKVLWKCLCDCGNTKVVCGNSLRSGATKSCGCLSRERASETHRVDLTGRKFGRLLVLEAVGSNKHGVLWKCLCDCGKISIVISVSLKGGLTKSCGCYNREMVLERRKQQVGKYTPGYKHGMTGTKEFANAKSARRRASKLQATSSWGSKELIDFYYIVAATMENMSVDHEIPLQGKTVCGLHVETNLQLLPKNLNSSKNNKYPLSDEEQEQYRGLKL